MVRGRTRAREGFCRRGRMSIAPGFAAEWYDLEVDCNGDRWLTFLVRRGR